jgi:hypothetical protein
MFFTRACPGFSPTPTDDEEEVVSRQVQSTEPFDVIEGEPNVFPNPSVDAVTVTLTNTLEPGTIQLFSGRDGSLVKSISTGVNQKEIRIDISDLPKGVYTVNIKSGETSSYIKLVKL